jgi:hypothetical protein
MDVEGVEFFSFAWSDSPYFAEFLHYDPFVVVLEFLEFGHCSGLQQFFNLFDDLAADSSQIFHISFGLNLVI